MKEEKRMKKTLRIARTLALLALTAAAAGLASCASTPYAPNERDVLRLVDLINRGEVTSVEGLTPVPFVLDTETLYLEGDVETMWKNLAEASFAMRDAKFASTERVGEDTWKTFAESYDMKNFFEKYTGADTSLVKVDTADGRYFLLLERKLKGYPRVRGLKGPVR